MTNASPPTYNCLICGACCAPEAPAESSIRLSEVDSVRLRGTGLPILKLDEQDSDPPEFIYALRTKPDPNGRRVCVALTGSAGGANSCSIYESRPGACRGFEVGGFFCRQARQRFGLPL